MLGYDILGMDDPGLVERRSIGAKSDGEADYRVPFELREKGYKWCRTCEIVRPPRASHCSSCDHCILRFDHHCPFVNNCVGQRNYAFFTGFVSSALCLAITVLPLIFWWMTAPSDKSSSDIMKKSSVRIAMLIIGLVVSLVAVALLGLWCYHLFLVATNRTTKEHRKSLENQTEEPTLCAPRGPRLFDPKAWIQVEILSGGELRPLPKRTVAG